MDTFGPEAFGSDGTQAPPPPRFFADPLAGLVTGADRVFPDALSGSATLEPAPAPPVEEPAGGASVTGVADSGLGAASGPHLHGPTGYRQSGRPAGQGARRPTARRTPSRPHQQGWNSPQAPQPSPYAYPRGQQPVANAPAPFVAPHAPLPPRAAQTSYNTVRPAQTAQKSVTGWIGCLVVLAVLGGLLFPVAAAILEALAKLFS